MQALSSKYDGLVDGAGEGEGILQHYASIIQLKKSEAKINLLISLQETEEDEREELRAMKENIEVALQEELAALREKQKKIDAYPLSLDLLAAQDVGKLAKCFLQEQRKWKNAEVQEVDVEQQVAKVRRYGTNELLQLPAYLLKVLREPDAELFKEGTHCKAIYSADGEFYPCVIEKVLEEGYQVKYKKYNTQEVVKLHRLRPMGPPQQQKEEESKPDPAAEFKVPQRLKILPNDPQNVKKSKKTKLKALKFAFKNAQIEQANKEKQQKWKDWNAGSASSQKEGHFKTKYDLTVFHQGKKQ